MRRFILALLLLHISIAHAQSSTTHVPIDYSTTLTTTAKQVMAALPQFGTRSYFQLEVNTANSIIACSWTNYNPQPWTAGSFTYSGQGTGVTLIGKDFVPTSALWCVANQPTSISIQGF